MEWYFRRNSRFIQGSRYSRHHLFADFTERIYAQLDLNEKGKERVKSHRHLSWLLVELFLLWRDHGRNAGLVIPKNRNSWYFSKAPLRYNLNCVINLLNATWTIPPGFDHQDPSGFSSKPSLNWRTAAPIARAPPGLDMSFVDWTDESVIDRWRGLRFGETAPPIQKLMASELLKVVVDPREKYQRDIGTWGKQDGLFHSEWKQKYTVPHWKHENSAPIPLCCFCKK